MNVIKIPAKPQKGNNTAKQEVKRLRVAAYCRVSTDNDEQATSYETQIEHYTEYINKNPEWVLVNVYADEGISATNTKKRDQFNAMIEDCKRGLIDIKVTTLIQWNIENPLKSSFFPNEKTVESYFYAVLETQKNKWVHNKTITIQIVLLCTLSFKYVNNGC